MDVATIELGRFIERLHVDTLPQSVVSKSKLCLLDALGCLCGAHQTPFGTTVMQYAQATAPTARRNGRPDKAALDPATHAACLALLINALDYDDIYWKGHPGATVNGAVLSLALHLNSSGTQILEAIVAGYEVSGRVAMSFGRSSPRKTVHGHGTWQTFGAAAAAAKLLKLDAHQAAHALAIAGANAPVPSVMKTVYGANPTMAKNNFFSAAHAGVCAGFMAKAGMEGPLDLFEGDTGFWKMAGAEHNDSARLTGGLGKAFEITDVGFKAFSCCRIIQACAQAAKTAFEHLGKDARLNTLDMIIAAVPEIACAPPFSISAPQTMWAAQFSVPHAITATLLDIPPGPQWFTPATLECAAAHPIRDKILLRPRRASNYHGAEISVMAGKTTVASASVKVATGDAAEPLAETFMVDKFIRLAAPVLNLSNAHKAHNAVAGLQSARAAGALFEAIGSALVA